MIKSAHELARNWRMNWRILTRLGAVRGPVAPIPPFLKGKGVMNWRTPTGPRRELAQNKRRIGANLVVSA